MLRQRNHDSAGAQDAGLLPRDRGYRRAQPFRVVEGDIGNHREQRVHAVGRVQPASHSRFQHRNLSAFLLKIGECLRGQYFKVARHVRKPAIPHQFLRRVMDAKVEPCKGIVGDLEIIQPDALVGPRQMRRRVQAGAQPGGRQD